MADESGDSEVLFGRLLVEQGLAKPEHVQECLRLQAQLAEARVEPIPRLGELLLRKGFLTSAQFDQTLRLLEASPGSSRPSDSRTPDIPPEASAGERVDRYLKTKKLGAGGMGEVWKAWDTGLRRWVALKFLKGQDPDEIARFRREAQTAANLAHPHIAAVFEATDAYIAMQFVEGQTLQSFPRPDLRRIAEMIRQAALAVHFAHGQGIIHRDLKPANIMVSPEGHVYVMDFGLARSTRADSKLSVSGAILGTPAYMSPEQARGGATLDARTDIYSLGATLYELLANRPPFQDENVYDLLKKVIEQDPKPIPGDLGTIATKCLEKDPARRYATALELTEDVSRFLQGEPILAHPPSLYYRWKKRLAKRRAVVLVGAAGLLLAAVVGAITLPRWMAARERQRRSAEADDLCRQAVERVNRARELWRIRASRREDWEKLFEEARAKVAEAIAAYPDGAGSYYTLGLVEVSQRRWPNAIEAFDRAIELNPSLAEAWRHRGLAWLERYQESLSESSKDESEEGKRRRLEPLRERAVADLEKYSSLTPGETVELRFVRASLAYADNKYEEALAACEELLSRDRTDEQFWRLKALALLRLDRPSDAIATLDLLINDVMPQMSAAYRIRGGLKEHLGDHRGAIDDCTRAIELNPKSAHAYSNRGVAKENLGDRQGALEDCSWAIQLDPQFANAYCTRGALKIRLRDLQGGLDDCSKAIELEPKMANAYGNRGAAKYYLGDAQGAVEDCSKAVELDPREATAYYVRGMCREKQDDLQRAIDDFSKVIALDSKHADAYQRRGYARLMIGDFRGAIEDSSKSIDLIPNDRTSYSIRGLAKRHLNDFKGAIEDYSEALRLDPKDATDYGNRGVAKKKLGDLKGAIEDYSEVIRLNPNNASAWSDRGVAKENSGDFKGAIEDLSEAIRLDSKDADNYEIRGLAREKSGDRKGAIEDYSEALRLDPKRASTWLDRGLLKEKLGDRKGAIEDCSEALRLDPKRFKAWLNRGLAKAKLGDDGKGAIEDLSEALRLDPKSSLAWSTRGAAKEMLGDPKGAIEDLSEALRLDPKSYPAWLNRGAAKYHLNDFQGAIDDYSKAIKLDPGRASPYRNRGAAKEELGNHQGAIDDYSKAIELDPKNTQVYLNRAAARSKLGDLKGAFEDYSEAIALDPQADTYRYRGGVMEKRGDLEGAIADYRKALDVAPEGWPHRESLRRHLEYVLRTKGNQR